MKGSVGLTTACFHLSLSESAVSPTDPFTILKPPNTSIYKLYAAWNCQSTDFETLKLGKGRLGHQRSVGSCLFRRPKFDHDSMSIGAAKKGIATQLQIQLRGFGLNLTEHFAILEPKTPPIKMFMRFRSVDRRIARLENSGMFDWKII